MGAAIAGTGKGGSSSPGQHPVCSRAQTKLCLVLLCPRGCRRFALKQMRARSWAVHGQCRPCQGFPGSPVALRVSGGEQSRCSEPQ